MPEGDQLTFFRIEREQLKTQLSEMKRQNDRLLVDLRDALRQVEHWRSLAEYREKVLADQRDGLLGL